MYSRWTTLCLVLIPAFGLISCSQDKSSDSWSLKEPTIKIDGNSVNIPVSAAPASIDANAILIFEKDDLKDVTLEFTSSCGSHQDKIEVSGTNEIPFASLWPRSAWQTIDSKRIAELECSISAVAKNRNGSTHKFRIGTRRLTNVNSSVGIGNSKIIKPTGVHTHPQELTAVSSDDYEIETDESSPREVALKCENFANLRVFSAYESAKEALKDLVSSQIIDPLARVQNSVTRDPRQEKTLQKCSLVRRTQNKTGLPVYDATPEFTMEFPHPAAAIVTRLGMRRADQTSMRDQTLYSFEMKNTSDRTLRYRIPKNLGSEVKLNAIIQPNDPKTFQIRNAFARTRPFNEATYISIDGGQLQSRLDDLILDLPPKSTATLHLKMKSKKTCMLAFTWDAPIIPIDQLAKVWSTAGFEMTFAKPIVIEQVRDFVGNEGLDQAKFIQVPLINQEESELGLWQTHDMWFRKTGSTAKPQVTETITDPRFEGYVCLREGTEFLSPDPTSFF